MGASDRAARGGSASGAWWALLDAQARRVRVVGIAVPLATAVLIAIAGSCWALAAGPASAALAMLGIMPLYAAAAGMCAAAVFTGDTLVELHASTPMEFRTVQTMRAAVLLVAAAVGGFALFASLHLAGAIYGDAGFAGGRGSSHGVGRVCGGAFRVDACDDSRRDARLAVLRVDMGSEHGVDAGAAARVAVARAARRRRVRMACPGLARARVEEAGRCAMRFLSLSVIHARMAARQRAIWVASLLLALLSMGVAVNTGLPFETGDVADLVFLAQMLAMLPPVAYAAAFTDLAAEPERLGISEVEASAPVRPMELTVARVVGALAVMTSPSAALLLFCAAGQMLHGNVWAPLQAIVLFAGVVLPAAFVAAALSALAGSLLPRIVARIVSVAAWLGTLFACSFKGVPASGGGVQFHIASDPLAQAFFGSQPFLDYQGPAPAAAPFEALALLVFKFAVAAALLAAAAAVARRRSYRRH